MAPADAHSVSCFHRARFVESVSGNDVDVSFAISLVGSRGGCQISDLEEHMMCEKCEC